jgi:resuscitation-promoting factor RpfB
MASVTLERQVVGRRTVELGTRAVLVAAVCLGSLLLWFVWRLTARPVTVTVDGMTETITTHRAVVADLLLDLGIQAGENDRIEPALDRDVTRGMTLTIERARPVRILADGRDFTVGSWGVTPREVLADAGIVIDTNDGVQVDGAATPTDAILPPRTVETAHPTFDRGFAWDALRSEPLQVRVTRAVPVRVHEGGLPYEINTTAETVGEALRQAEVILYLGDRVQPSLGSRVTASMDVFIERSVPVTMEADGVRSKTRTQAKSVGDALSDLGVVVAGMDRVEPPLETALYDDIKISVTRVREDVEVEEEIAPYETVFFADPNLAIDTQQVVDPGANGITRMRYRVRYENGEEATRVLEDTWTAQEPAERRIAYGQSITPQTATVDGQTITYWRKLKMYATSYHPAALGGDNVTATGEILTKGVVAVDPRIIRLRSQLYVPGYGVGNAFDTGGGIISRRIDLGFDDSNYQSMSKWVDVYLLWPPPADYQITWVLPNYPPVPQ